MALRRLAPPGTMASTASVASAALRSQRRGVGAELLTSAAKLGTSQSLQDSLRANDKARVNKEIMKTLADSQSQQEIQFRKEDRPWEIVPQFVKRRVVDLVGILSSEHRMEIEQTIDRMVPLCDVQFYLVIVPTVGYVPPRVFAQSVFFDWGIGEPRGNGVLLLLSQGDASVQLIASPGIEDYFGQEFCDLLVKEVLQPLLKAGKPSYALVQTVEAVARHSHEARHLWTDSLVPLPVRNKVRFSQKVFWYGIFETWSLYWALLLTALTATFWNKLIDMVCPECGTWMLSVEDEDMIAGVLDDGQRLEWRNGCTQFRIQKCPNCKYDSVRVALRDMYNNNKCLKCDDCNYHTVNMVTDVQKLPTKKEDGLKVLTYSCEHCRVGREIHLPLFRPLDKNPDQPWYDFLLEGAANAKSSPDAQAKQSKN